MATLDQARAAKERAMNAFADVAQAVVGVGITRVGQDYAVKVNLSEAPADDVRLPEEIDGVPVRVEVVGPIRKR